MMISGCGSSGPSVSTIDDPEEAFKAAKLSYDKGDYAEAVQNFSLIKIKFSGTSVIDKTMFYLAMTYYQRKEFILGAYEFENLLKNYSSTSYQVEARYQLAMCYYKLSPKYQLDQTYTYYAINELQNFIVLFPKHKYVADVDKMIKELRNKLALKEYKSAELYIVMENYKAAIVYYDNIMNEYFDTDFVDDALLGKINALYLKKQYFQANDEIKKFKTRYPKSELLPKVLLIEKQIQN